MWRCVCVTSVTTLENDSFFGVRLIIISDELSESSHGTEDIPGDS